MCRLIWISGPPGLGKSTSAQLLSREHGFVYYEADCFFELRNPYIPPDVENPTLATRMQRKLIGEYLVKQVTTGCPKKRTFTMLLEPQCTGSIASSQHPLCLEINLLVVSY